MDNLQRLIDAGFLVLIDRRGQSVFVTARNEAVYANRESATISAALESVSKDVFGVPSRPAQSQT